MFFCRLLERIDLSERHFPTKLLIFSHFHLLLQNVLAAEKLTFKFLDVVTILLNYCCPKLQENKETKAVITDLIKTLGYFCANNKKNQVSKFFNTETDKFSPKYSIYKTISPHPMQWRKWLQEKYKNVRKKKLLFH